MAVKKKCTCGQGSVAGGGMRRHTGKGLPPQVGVRHMSSKGGHAAKGGFIPLAPLAIAALTGAISSAAAYGTNKLLKKVGGRHPKTSMSKAHTRTKKHH